MILFKKMKWKSMPLNSSLIRGAKFVWGKTQLQFGKTTLQVFSDKKI
jgi:hypothetical protein